MQNLRANKLLKMALLMIKAANHWQHQRWFMSPDTNSVMKPKYTHTDVWITKNNNPYRLRCVGLTWSLNVSAVRSSEIFYSWFIFSFIPFYRLSVTVQHVGRYKCCQSPAMTVWKYMLFLDIQLSQAVYHKHAVPLSYSWIFGGLFFFLNS